MSRKGRPKIDPTTRKPRKLFTKAQLKIIDDNQGLINLKDLAKLLNIKYERLGRYLEEAGIVFEILKKPVKVPNSDYMMVKRFADEPDEKGNPVELFTDYETFTFYG